MGDLTMQHRSPRDAVNEYLKAFRSKNLDGVIAQLHPDVVVYEAESTPFPLKEYHGHAGYREMNAFFRSYWAETAVGEEGGRIVSDDQIAVLVSTLLGRPSGSSEWLRVPIMERFVVVDGRIKEIWPYYFDPAALPRYNGPQPVD